MSTVLATSLVRLLDDAGRSAVEASPTSAGPSVWVWVATLSLLLALAIWLGFRYGRRTGNALEDGFLQLAAPLRLSQDDRVLVRSLASDIDVPPATLLLSESVFDYASAAALGDDRRLDVARVRDRLFGIPSA